MCTVHTQATQSGLCAQNKLPSRLRAKRIRWARPKTKGCKISAINISLTDRSHRYAKWRLEKKNKRQQPPEQATVHRWPNIAREQGSEHLSIDKHCLLNRVCQTFSIGRLLAESAHRRKFEFPKLWILNLRKLPAFFGKVFRNRNSRKKINPELASAEEVRLCFIFELFRFKSS